VKSNVAQAVIIFGAAAIFAAVTALQGRWGFTIAIAIGAVVGVAFGLFLRLRRRTQGERDEMDDASRSADGPSDGG